MNTVESLQWRYAVKKFDPNKLVPQHKINIIKEAFNLTASSYGLQPLKLLIIQNKDIQQELISHSWKQSQVVDCSHLLVLCVPKNYSVEDVETYFNLVKKVRNTPDTIMKPFKDFLTNEVESKTQKELFQWNKNQAYLTLGNLLTVCALEKIDSCPMEGFDPVKYDEILNLHEQNLTSILLLPIGYRAEDDFMKALTKVRKDIEDTVIEMY